MNVSLTLRYLIRPCRFAVLPSHHKLELDNCCRPYEHIGKYFHPVQCTTLQRMPSALI